MIKNALKVNPAGGGSKTRKARLLFFSIMLIISVFALSACSNATTLYVYNWGEYINPEVIDIFEEETGIRVRYTTFETNEDMYIKVTAGNARYDVIIPSEYMIDKMVKEDLLLPLDYANIPNAQHIDPDYRNLAHDPDNVYSVPYISGTLGIVYNTSMVGEPVDSWSILWDEKYEGNILMLDSIRDSFAVSHILLGQSLNATDPIQIEAAKEKLLEQKPLVRAWLVDKVISDMEADEAALAITWSCDFLQMEQRNPRLKYAIPNEGSNLWLDSMVIPNTAMHKTEAEMFINFMCRSDIALMNSEYLGNPTMQTEARQLQDSAIINNPAAYPPSEALSRCEVMLSFDEETLKAYDKAWTELGVE